MSELDLQDVVSRVILELDLFDLQATKLDDFLSSLDASSPCSDNTYLRIEEVRLMLMLLTGRVRGFLSGEISLGS